MERRVRLSHSLLADGADSLVTDAINTDAGDGLVTDTLSCCWPTRDATVRVGFKLFGPKTRARNPSPCSSGFSVFSVLRHYSNKTIVTSIEMTHIEAKSI